MTNPTPLHRARAESCLSDLLLDRLIDGELVNGDSHEAAQRHLDQCSACATRLESLRSNIASFSQEVFVSGLVARAHRELRPNRHRARRWQVASAGLMVAAAAALLLWVRSVPSTTPQLRAKGGAAIDLVVRHSDGTIEPVTSGSELRAGDAIRFLLSTQDDGYYAIVSIDSAHAITVYAPHTGAMPAIAAGRRQEVPGSTVLDATLGPERIFALICDAPLPLDQITEQAASALADANGHPKQIESLQLPCIESTVWFLKVP